MHTIHHGIESLTNEIRCLREDIRTLISAIKNQETQEISYTIANTLDEMNYAIQKIANSLYGENDRGTPKDKKGNDVDTYNNVERSSELRKPFMMENIKHFNKNENSGLQEDKHSLQVKVASDSSVSNQEDSKVFFICL